MTNFKRFIKDTQPKKPMKKKRLVRWRSLQKIPSSNVLPIFDEISKRWENEKSFLIEYKEFVNKSDYELSKVPVMGFVPINYYTMFKTVLSLGGSTTISNHKLWLNVYASQKPLKLITNATFVVKKHYDKYLLGFEKYMLSIYGKKLEKKKDATDLITQNHNYAMKSKNDFSTECSSVDRCDPNVSDINTQNKIHNPFSMEKILSLSTKKSDRKEETFSTDNVENDQNNSSNVSNELLYVKNLTQPYPYSFMQINNNFQSLYYPMPIYTFRDNHSQPITNIYNPNFYANSNFLIPCKNNVYNDFEYINPYWNYEYFNYDVDIRTNYFTEKHMVLEDSFSEEKIIDPEITIISQDEE